MPTATKAPVATGKACSAGHCLRTGVQLCSDTYCDADRRPVAVMKPNLAMHDEIDFTGEWCKKHLTGYREIYPTERLVMVGFEQFGSYFGLERTTDGKRWYLVCAAMNVDGSMDASVGEVENAGDTPAEAFAFLQAINEYFGTSFKPSQFGWPEDSE